MFLSRRRWLLAAGALPLSLFAFGLSGCRHEVDPWPESKGLRVLTTFPPLCSFTQNVAGPDAVVFSLLANEGPHGYQYNPRDARLLHGANLFFSNGLTLDDHFAVRMAKNCGNSRLIHVQLGDTIPARRLLEMTQHEHSHDHAGHHHHHGSSDPHVWLGIDEAILMVECIRDTLAANDPPHAADYGRRAGEYTTKLKQLHADGKKMLAGKKIDLVTVHESLGYFGRSFGLNIVGSIQVQPGDDPSPSWIGDLAKLCVEKRVRLIAVEPQYSTNLARTLRGVLKEKGVPDPVLVEIDPLETAERDEVDAGWYERKMRQNLDALAEALR